MKKNYTLYFLQTIACLSVILIHCELPGHLGDIFETLARFAVPIFFIISGYFNSYSSEDKMKIRIKKMLKLFILSFLIYVSYINIEQLVINRNYNFINFNLKLFNLNNIINMILFNYTTFICSHLWYILALIYIYVVKIICIKKQFQISKKMVIILCLLPFVGNVINIISNHLVENPIGGYYRNWFFVGLPFYFIGEYLKQHEEEIKINNMKVIIFAIIGFIISIFERIIVKIIFNIKFNLYFGTIIAVISLFIFCIKNNKTEKNLIAEIGEKYSIYIYIIHYLIIFIFENILINHFNIIINGYILPIVVIFASLIVSVVIRKIIKTLNLA